MFLSMALRNVSRRKIRSLITIIAIAISSSLYVSLDLLNTGVTYTAIEAYTDYIGDFDILVRGSQKIQFFNATNVSNVIESIEHVEVAAPRLILGSIAEVNLSRSRVFLVGIDVEKDNNIGELKLVEGSNSLDFYNSCLVVDSLAVKLNIHQGDVLRFYFNNFSGSLNIVNVQVSGIVKQVGKLPVDMTTVVFFNLYFLQEIFGEPDLANFVFVKLSNLNYDNVESAIRVMRDVARSIQNVLGLNYNVQTVKATMLYNLEESIQSFVSLLMIFATVSILMSIILVFSTINMNFNERVREIGIIKAIGGGNLQIFTSFQIESLTLGLGGSTLGLIIGTLIYENFLIKFFLPRKIFTNGGLYITVNTVGIAVILGLSSSLIGGLYPSIKALRVPPAEAISPLVRRVKFLEKVRKIMNPETPNYAVVGLGLVIFGIMSFLIAFLPVISFFGSTVQIFLSFFVMLTLSLIGVILIFMGLLPLIVKHIDKILKIPPRLSLILAKVNIVRERRRSILVFFMIALAIASILLIGYSMGTQKNTIITNVRVTQGADIVVYSDSPIPLNYTNILKDIEGIKGVVPVSNPLTVKVGDIIMWSTSSVNMFAVYPLEYYNYSYFKDYGGKGTINDFISLASNYTVIISTGLAKKLDLNVGDKLRLDLGSKTVLLDIVGVENLAPGFHFTRFEQKAIQTDILVSFETLKLIQGIEPVVSKFLIDLEDSGNSSFVADAIDELLGSNYDIQIVSTSTVIKNAVSNVSQLGTILSFLLYFAVVIAILGHITFITTSLYERTWEMGILRSMGGSLRQIIEIYIMETLLLALLAYLAGTFSATIVYMEMNWSNNLISEYEIPLMMPLEHLVLSLITISIPACIVTFMLVRKFASRDVSELIRKATEI